MCLCTHTKKKRKSMIGFAQKPPELRNSGNYIYFSYLKYILLEKIIRKKHHTHKLKTVHVQIQTNGITRKKSKNEHKHSA